MLVPTLSLFMSHSLCSTKPRKGSEASFLLVLSFNLTLIHPHKVPGRHRERKSPIGFALLSVYWVPCLPWPPSSSQHPTVCALWRKRRKSSWVWPPSSLTNPSALLAPKSCPGRTQMNLSYGLGSEGLHLTSGWVSCKLGQEGLLERTGTGRRPAFLCGPAGGGGPGPEC